MIESTEMSSTSASPVLATETAFIEKSLSTVVIKKRHFADVWSLFAGQERQKYDLITSTTLKKLT